jgi:hypothetical protein
MAPGKPPDPRKEQHWRRWLRLWQQSCLSVRPFCARHGLTQPRFYPWRRTLQQRAAAFTPFLPVQVLPDPEPASTGSNEVILAGGRRLRVQSGFDPDTLR